VGELYVAGGAIFAHPHVANDIWYAPLEPNATAQAPSKPQNSPEPYGQTERRREGRRGACA